MSTSRQCYFPNHKPAPGNYPCSEDAVTHCCASNAICLSNGYCMDLGQPFTLSRGACTSDTWAAGCPTQCAQSEFASMGSSIVNMFYNSTTGVSDYCCGTPIGTGNGQGVQCQHNEPSFTLPQANILPGYGALKGYTCTTSNSTDNSTTTCSNSSTSAAAPTSSSSHDVALGAGLGVPLGVIALGSLLWGFYERRRASRLSRALTQNGVPAQGLLATPQTPQSRSVNKSSAPTELDSRRRYAELQGSH